MAKGYQQHQEHKAAVAALGRIIARRAKNGCELCLGSNALKVIEVAPLYPGGPDVERAILACADCTAAQNRPVPKTAHALRFLTERVWSDVLPVQLMAVRWLHRLADANVDWAQEARETLYLDPDVEELV